MVTSNIPSDAFTGRSVLRTDLSGADLLDAEKVKADLVRVLPYHAYNASQIAWLQEYHRGWHPYVQERVKTTRTDVDNKITVNHAWGFTRDIVGYFLGKPIQYTHRQGKYRVQMENFINVMLAESKALVDYQIAEDCSICGVGYRGMFAEPTARNGTKLKLLRLDPTSTFVVRSSNPIEPPAYAVSFYEDQGNDAGEVSVYYKVYTPAREFMFKLSRSGLAFDVGIENLELQYEKAINFGGGLPIQEYENNLVRMGDWETCIALMDALDIVTSDGVNDIQQAVNSVLVAMGMELTEENFANLSKSGLLNVKDIPPGVTPVVEFINQAMDADVGVSMREYLEATLRVIVGVPDRKTRGGGGGDTGDAVFMRDGWQDIDLVATAKEQYFIRAERDALDVMLYILSTTKEVKNLDAKDIAIHFNRNKTSNLQSKAQTYQTLTTGDAPLAPVDALDMVGLTNNVTDVILRAESYASERAQKRIEEAQAGAPNSQQGGMPTEGDGDTTE